MPPKRKSKKREASAVNAGVYYIFYYSARHVALLKTSMSSISMLLVRRADQRLAQLQNPTSCHGPNRCLYSIETMKALTISALTKFPLN